MKKLLAILLAGLMLITTMSVVAWADDDEPIGETFPTYTIGEFYQYRATITEEVLSEADRVNSAFYKYILATDGLYLPEGYSINDVTELSIVNSYVSVRLELDEGYLSLYSYNYVPNSYSDAKTYAETGKYSGMVLENEDGVDVYYYNFGGNDHTYWWVQEGEGVFCLRFSYSGTDENDNEDLYSDELLKLCNLTYHSFSEAYNFTAEVADGKVKLSWDEVVEDETYTVYWKRSSSDEWKVAGTTTKHKVNITGLKSGVSYDFKIEATGLESETITVTAE